MKYRVFVGLAMVTLFGALSGCKDQLAPGHYEGNLWHKSKQERVQESVKIEVSPLVSPSKKGSFLMEVKTPEGIPVITASFYLLKTKQLKIHSDFLCPDGIIADPVASQQFRDPEYDRDAQCFRSPLSVQGQGLVSNSGATFLEFCFKKDRFLLDFYDEMHISVLELSGNTFSHEEEFKLEEPVNLTLTEAVEIAFERNFTSRIAYQQALQARFEATAAYLNLVPHLTSNLIWNAAPNYITFIATLQGLVPFLLPSYWFQAKEAGVGREIKDLAWVIMRANLATTVEELAYSLTRDEGIISAQQVFLQEVQNFQVLLNQINLPSESLELLLDLTSFTLEGLTSDLGDMVKLVRQDRFSLAQALGFHNLDAIKHLELGPDSLTIELAVPVDSHAMAQLACERSFELKQLDDLKKIAQIKKLENYFIWLDPSGDPKQSLGLNTFPQQKKLKSQILELEIEREETKTRLYQNAYKLALDYNEAIKSFSDLERELDNIHFDFPKILADAVAGLPIRATLLKRQAQKYSASLVARQMILANFRIARAKKDRFLLAGYYAQTLPRLQEPAEVRPPFLRKLIAPEL